MSSNARYFAFYNYLRDTCLTGPAACVPSTIQYTSPVDVNHYVNAELPTPDGRHVAFQIAPLGSNSLSGDLELADTCLGTSSGCTPHTQVLLSANTAVVFPMLTSITADARFIPYALGLGRTGVPNPLRANIYDTCLGAPVGCTPTSISINNAALSVPVDSDDARYSVFQQPGPGTFGRVVVLHDSCLGASPGCVASDTVLSDPSMDCAQPSISGDAQYAVYSCTNISPPSIALNVYLQTTCAGISGCTSLKSQITFGATTPNFQNSSYPAVSSGGRFIAFVTSYSSLNVGDMVYVMTLVLEVLRCALLK